MENRSKKANTVRKMAVFAMAFLLTAAGLLAVSMTALADDASVFVPGTKVNGIGIGKMTVEEAKERIEGFYSSEYKLTITEQGGKAETISGTDIGYSVTAPEELAALLSEQNRTGRLSGPNVDNSHTMQLTAHYNEEALMTGIENLSCISGSSVVVTKDAHISEYREGEPFVIIPEVHGSSVNREKTVKAVEDAVRTGVKELNLEAADCYDRVAVTADDQKLKDLCDSMNRCKDMTITYKFGSSSEILGGKTICSWFLGSTGGEIDINRELAAAYVQTLADQYDTAGKSRIFHTAGDKDAEVMGPYGWKINTEAETDALIAMVRTGESGEREPVYALTAADRDHDWGGTYAEVDLTGQHAYFFQDGVLVWDAPCVTGDISKDYTTPPGIYSLTYKETDRILRGKKREDGQYEYETHVDYWMPFNGGIGFHDAVWRNKFGGTYYQNGGSHGCINLPPAKAKELYGMIGKGMPVICYN